MAEDLEKALYKALFQAPISRRMACYLVGKDDRTYCVTNQILKFIESGKAQVVGKIRCRRSGRLVEAVTTNPDFFKDNNDNELEIF